jgi:Mn-dependent DtxR family transcriptional regulator
MSLDRLHSNDVHTTHETIAALLGVRRESITETIGQLQREGLVKKSRGRLSILNRHRIEQRVCECYSMVCQEYNRLLPPVPKP